MTEQTDLAARAAQAFDDAVIAAYLRNGQVTEPHSDPTIQEMEFELWDANHSDVTQVRRLAAWAWMCPDVEWDLDIHDEFKDEDEA